jgi:Cu(I)/Ag(I) efflux system membrane fusion protein
MNKLINILLSASVIVSCSDTQKESVDVAPQTKSESSSNTLMLNDSQMKLANVTTQKVSLRDIGQTVMLNAKLSVNEEASEIISTRAAGRIDKLFVKETGRSVKKGQPLYELYSEPLLTLQREFLLAKEQFETLGKGETRYESFYKASERKLLLYGLSKKQIEQLGQSKSIQDRITFLAPVSGIITEVNATEGQYLAEGGALYKIENISNLWVEAELYPNEKSLVNMGDMVNIRVNGYESKPVQGKVIFLSPEYRTNTQIVILRVQLENTARSFMPGMQAQIVLTHSSKKGLAIPVDAVIRNEKGTHVYVQTDTNTFEPRMIKTGLEDFDQVEVTEGLKEGEIIAISGAYLLYSELILKKGADPMATHTH